MPWMTDRQAAADQHRSIYGIRHEAGAGGESTAAAGTVPARTEECLADRQPTGGGRIKLAGRRRLSVDPY